MLQMFTVEQRDEVRRWVLETARADPRIVAGAAVGGSAGGEGDRWSDLDLTFAAAEGESLSAMLGEWGRLLGERYDAIELFDLPSGASIYRVFLLRGCLQFDLSLTPESQFRPRGPRFSLLFGTARERVDAPQASTHDTLGLGVHHALRARLCIERGRGWQAEYWISGIRDQAVVLACRRRGLPEAHGRGADRLPADVLEALEHTLVRSTERGELLRALVAAVSSLRSEAAEVAETVVGLEPRLREITAATIS
ncbi:MAG TPA: nucleotidyltransferase domain-containing protein [Candidatus Dormibacteraeota bacterium]|jgi:hypothetical protein|nr:nucleotidyltransferase domain-containing protein [Candidatus Dormibacteraeota bacterium]